MSFPLLDQLLNILYGILRQVSVELTEINYYIYTRLYKGYIFYR